MKVYFEEADLRETICPFTFAIPEQRGANDGIREAGPWHCHGGRCLAWRWARTHIKDPASAAGDMMPSDDTHGYCGLAGKP